MIEGCNVLLGFASKNLFWVGVIHDRDLSWSGYTYGLGSDDKTKKKKESEPQSKSVGTELSQGIKGKEQK